MKTKHMDLYPSIFWSLCCCFNTSVYHLNPIKQYWCRSKCLCQYPEPVWWPYHSWPLSKVGSLEHLTRSGLDALKQTGTYENARENAGLYTPTSACWRSNRHWQSDRPFEPAPISLVSKLAHTFAPLARCVRTVVRAITASALWWTAGARKKSLLPDFCKVRSWPTLSDVSCFIPYTSFRPIATEAITIKSNARNSKVVAFSKQHCDYCSE